MSAQPQQTRTELTTKTANRAAAATDADGVPLEAALSDEACPRRLDFGDFATAAANDERTAALAEAFPFPAQAERRKAPRVKYQVVATLELDGDEFPTPGAEPAAYEVQTRDVGEGGAGIMAPHDLTPGAAAVLNLPGPDGTVSRVTCRVRRARPVAEGWFEGYVEFEGGGATAAKSPFSDERIAR